MTRKHKSLIIMAIALFVSINATASFSEPESVKSQEAATLEARTITSTLAAKTKTLLSESLATGDTLKAITVCAITAPEIMDEFNKKPSYTVRRTSLKTRNPKNMPDFYEKKVLKEMDELKNNGKLAANYESVRVVIESDNIEYLRYIKPLIVETTCLNCHGQPGNMPADVKKFLKRFYPADHAVGYKEGDVRGAISIKIPLKFPPK